MGLMDKIKTAASKVVANVKKLATSKTFYTGLAMIGTAVGSNLSTSSSFSDSLVQQLVSLLQGADPTNPAIASAVKDILGGQMDTKTLLELLTGLGGAGTIWQRYATVKQDGVLKDIQTMLGKITAAASTTGLNGTAEDITSGGSTSSNQ